MQRCKMAAIESQVTSGFEFSDGICLIRRNVCAGHISMDYLNPLLQYYYIRLLKTNGRHICNSTSGFVTDLLIVISMSFYIGVPNFIEIGTSAT